MASLFRLSRREGDVKSATTSIWGAPAPSAPRPSIASGTRSPLQSLEPNTPERAKTTEAILAVAHRAASIKKASVTNVPSASPASVPAAEQTTATGTAPRRVHRVNFTVYEDTEAPMAPPAPSPPRAVPPIPPPPAKRFVIADDHADDRDGGDVERTPRSASLRPWLREHLDLPMSHITVRRPGPRHRHAAQRRLVPPPTASAPAAPKVNLAVAVPLPRPFPATSSSPPRTPNSDHVTHSLSVSVGRVWGRRKAVAAEDDAATDDELATCTRQGEREFFSDESVVDWLSAMPRCTLTVGDPDVPDELDLAATRAYEAARKSTSDASAEG